MIVLNFDDLNEESQERILANSKKDVEVKYGLDMMHYAKDSCENYERLLEEEAMRNLYNYKFCFKI